MKIQIIRSKPSRTIVATYTTKSGQVKNRYGINKDSLPVKTIKHTV